VVERAITNTCLTLEVGLAVLFAVLAGDDAELEEASPSELAGAGSEPSALEAAGGVLSADNELVGAAGVAPAAGLAAAVGGRVWATADRWTTTRWRSAAITADGAVGCPTAALRISAVARAEVAATVRNCDQLSRIARSREIMVR
jgi:hypothetical protein